MSMINKEIADFKVYAFHGGEFKFISKEEIMGKWSVFFFYPADFRCSSCRILSIGMRFGITLGKIISHSGRIYKRTAL